jgi:hypothetical protein
MQQKCFIVSFAKKFFLKGLGHELELEYFDKMDSSMSNKNLFWFFKI